MSSKRASCVPLIAVLVLLAGGASQPMKAGDAGVEGGTADRPCGLPAGIRSSTAASAGAPCFLQGPPFEVHIDTSSILLGDVVYNPEHDEYLVVWDKYVSQPTYPDYEVWAARVGPDAVVRATFKVAGEQGKQLRSPAVAYSPLQDQYLVAYQLNLSGSGNLEISARRVSWDGSWKSNQFPIRHGPDDQGSPQVAYSGAHDEYLVVYWNDWASGSSDIAAQRVRASDGALLSWRTIITGPNEERYSPHVAYNAARDEYLVVYTYSTGTASQEVRGSRFPYDMATVYPEITISDAVPRPYGGAEVAVGPDGYLVLWTRSPGSMDDADIRGRWVSGEGIAQGPSAGFDVAGADSTHTYILWDIAYSMTLGYLAALEYASPNTKSDVLGRFVEPGQDAAAGELFPLFDFPEYQRAPRVACAPHAHCLIVGLDSWDPDGLNRFAIRGLLLGPCPRVLLPLVLRSH